MLVSLGKISYDINPLFFVKCINIAKPYYAPIIEDSSAEKVSSLIFGKLRNAFDSGYITPRKLGYIDFLLKCMEKYGDNFDMCSAVARNASSFLTGDIFTYDSFGLFKEVYGKEKQELCSDATEFAKHEVRLYGKVLTSRGVGDMPIADIPVLRDFKSFSRFGKTMNEVLSNLDNPNTKSKRNPNKTVTLNSYQLYSSMVKAMKDLCEFLDNIN